MNRMLTSIEEGLLAPLNTPCGQTDNDLRNNQRFQAWQTRSGNTPDSPQSAADYAPSIGGAVFLDCLTALLWVGIFVGGCWLAWQVRAISSEPEMRCFSQTDGEYCRVQRVWEIN